MNNNSLFPMYICTFHARGVQHRGELESIGKHGKFFGTVIPSLLTLCPSLSLVSLRQLVLVLLLLMETHYIGPISISMFPHLISSCSRSVRPNIPPAQPLNPSTWPRRGRCLMDCLLQGLE